MKQHYSIFKLLAFSLVYSATFAQGQANIWYFGNKAGLDFSSGNPTTLYNGQLNTIEGCATLSDANGNLLFYTNGTTVWNKNHVVMDNGNGLFGDPSSSQASAIVQKPGSTAIFYIFTTNAFDNNGGFRYSQVDMSANGGNGAVTAKNTLLSDSVTEKLAVVTSDNGQDVWVVTHLLDSDGFSALKITSGGISPAQVISHAGCTVPADDDRANAIGYMKVSADGKKIVTCHTYLGKAELLDFDSATGQITNARSLCNTGHVYGAEFSPDNSVLYISTVDERQLFQFDLNAANVGDSKILLSTFAQSLGALQLAPNGKIYIAMAEIDKLSVINNPNHLGSGCNISTNSIDLDGRVCMLGLPNFNQTILYTKVNAQNFCAGNSTAFGFEASFTPQSVSWNFGDASPLSNQAAPSHHYNLAGSYMVTVTAYYPGGHITRTKEIAISPAPTVSNIAAQSFCVSGSEHYLLSSNDTAVLHGQPASDFAVTYYANPADAQNAVNALPDDYTLTPGSVTIYANIKSLAPSGCSATTHFTLNAYTQPIDTMPTDFTTCDGLVRDGLASFDLDTKTDEILHGQPEAGYSVKYYTSEDDAENGVSPIQGAFTNTVNAQPVYARITNDNGCYKVVSFKLIVARCNDADDDIFPKFFTPNSDGYNDTWKTKATVGAADMKINIFDRFGRLLKTITQNDSEWDGTMNGVDLPSDDYWFVASGKNIPEIRGHFSLKR